MSTLKYLLTLGIAMLPICGFAQKLEIGPIYEGENNFRPQIVGVSGNQLFTIDVEGDDELMLESYNKQTLEREYFKTIELDVGASFKLKSLKKLEDVVFLKGKVLVIIRNHNVKEDYSELIIHTIDASTAELMHVDTLLRKEMEDLPTVTTPEKAQRRMGVYDFKTSKNDERLIIHSISQNFEIDRIFEEILLLDSELNLLQKKEFIREKEEDLIPKNIVIDNEGSIYYIQGDDFVFLDYFQDYEVWREPLPSDIFASNAFPSNISASFKPDGNLVLIAQYVTEDLQDTDEKKDRDEREEGDTQVEGVVYLEVDGFSKEIKQVKVSMFEKDLLDEFLTEDLIDDEHTPEVNNIFDQFSYQFEDSVTYVIGEARTLDEKLNRFVEWNNLIIYAFNLKGELIWVHHIPKFQKAILSSGYTTFTDDDHLYLFFQESKDNFEAENRLTLDLDYLSRNEDGIPIIYSFKKYTGEQQYEIFPSWNREDFRLIPDFSYPVEKGEGLFMFMMDDDDYRLSRIKF